MYLVIGLIPEMEGSEVTICPNEHCYISIISEVQALAAYLKNSKVFLSRQNLDNGINHIHYSLIDIGTALQTVSSL